MKGIKNMEMNHLVDKQYHIAQHKRKPSLDPQPFHGI